MVEKSIYDIMLCNNIIYKLFEQQINYPVNIAYKLYKLKKDFDEIETLMIDRWKILFGEDYNVEEFNDEQITLYNATLTTKVGIDIHGLTISEITDNDKVTLSISDVEYLDKFLNE